MMKWIHLLLKWERLGSLPYRLYNRFSIAMLKVKMMLPRILWVITLLHVNPCVSLCFGGSKCVGLFCVCVCVLVWAGGDSGDFVWRGRVRTFDVVSVHVARRRHIDCGVHQKERKRQPKSLMCYRNDQTLSTDGMRVLFSIVKERYCEREF